jgi:acyl-CoA synthetase (AMP-forming)/AMP-acid ligase II
MIISLHETAERLHEKTAVIEYRSAIFKKSGYWKKSYGQLFRDIAATGDNLKKAGFTKGDRVIVFVPMSYELYVVCLSLAYIGAVSVFIDAWADKDRLSKACLVVNPKGFIGSLKAQILRINPEIRKIPVKKNISSLVSINSAGSYEFNPAIVEPDDDALITLTTGTTGLPKGARRTHGSLSAQFTVLAKHLKYHEDCVDLTALPIFVFLNIASGMTSVLPIFNPAKPSSFDPAVIIRQVKELNITTAIGSPVFFEKIADYLSERGETLTFKSIVTGGAPVFKRLAKKMVTNFSGTEIEIVYGCTEAEPISGIPVNDYIDSDSAKGVCVGRKVSEIDVKIIKPVYGEASVDKDGSIKGLLAGKNQPGEIIVSGSHVLKEYLGDSSLFRKNKINENGKIWHRTGDAGIIDDNGYIYILGRIGKGLTSRGESCYPIPYEQRLLDIPGIKFASVIEKNGKVYAVVEPDNRSGNYSDIKRKVKDELNDLNPDEILVLNIPRDPRHNSKVNFDNLMKLLP